MPPSPRSQTIHELRPQDLAGSPRLAEAAGILREALAERFLLVWFAPVEMSFLAGIFGGRTADVAPAHDRRAIARDRGRGRACRGAQRSPAMPCQARRGVTECRSITRTTPSTTRW